MRRFRIPILASAFVALFAGIAIAQDPTSIQLVGNFNGITCEPDDPANNMEPMGDHVWRKLKFINEPGTPDTVFFKFARDGSYLPKHWGWSSIWGWGIAEFAWSPPNIAAALSDSGYHYFYFRDTDYAYWIERPAGSIHGTITAENSPGVPQATVVTLYDSVYNVIGTFDSFTDSTFLFNALAPSIYQITVQAPGYRDTTIEGVALGMNESKDVPIYLAQIIGVLIASASSERVGGGVRITWCTMACGGYATFDVYRGYAPDFMMMEKRNSAPVSSSRIYEFFDPCENPTKDLYYYLVERGGDNPTRFGPIFVKADAAPAAMLGQNYPNPFNPSTTIPYSVSAAGAGKPVTISFYNVAGKLVDSHALGAKQAGSYTFRWNPLPNKKRSLPSGVYYCTLRIDKETYTQKLILLR